MGIYIRLVRNGNYIGKISEDTTHQVDTLWGAEMASRLFDLTPASSQENPAAAFMRSVRSRRDAHVFSLRQLPTLFGVMSSLRDRGEKTRLEFSPPPIVQKTARCLGLASRLKR